MTFDIYVFHRWFWEYENIFKISTLVDSQCNKGYVKDEALPAIYQSATALLFPSIREGFGIPILEAFQNGLPVAAANSTAIPEVTGNAAILFNPFDTEEIANAMNQLVSNPVLRQRLINRGYKRANQFDWDNSAEKLIRLFEDLYTNLWENSAFEVRLRLPRFTS